MIDACSRLPCWNANPVESFHAATTRPDPEAAIAVSLWPPSRSSFTSAASTFEPMATDAPATLGWRDAARGGFSHAFAPCDTHLAFRCCATTWRNVGFVTAFAGAAAPATTSAATQTHPSRRISASLRNTWSCPARESRGWDVTRQMCRAGAEPATSASSHSGRFV